MIAEAEIIGFRVGCSEEFDLWVVNVKNLWHNEFLGIVKPRKCCEKTDAEKG